MARERGRLITIDLLKTWEVISYTIQTPVTPFKMVSYPLGCNTSTLQFHHSNSNAQVPTCPAAPAKGFNRKCVIPTQGPKPQEVRDDPNIILMIDEIHTLVGAGGGGDGGAMDAANILKPALARGDMQIIGAPVG